MSGATVQVEMFFAKSEVIQEREVLVYDFYDLIGDIGGYLGLLLGASLLSIYDGIVYVINTYAARKKNKRNKNARKVSYPKRDPNKNARKVSYPMRDPYRKRGVSVTSLTTVLSGGDDRGGNPTIAPVQ